MRPRRLARGLAYAVVLIGFVTWIATGGWHNPADQPGGARVPMVTLGLALATYLVVSWLQDTWDERQMRRYLAQRWRDIGGED